MMRNTHGRSRDPTMKRVLALPNNSDFDYLTRTFKLVLAMDVAAVHVNHQVCTQLLLKLYQLRDTLLCVYAILHGTYRKLIFSVHDLTPHRKLETFHKTYELVKLLDALDAHVTSSCRFTLPPAFAVLRRIAEAACDDLFDFGVHIALYTPKPPSLRRA